MSLTSSFYICDLFHALYYENRHYRARTLAEQLSILENASKNASFVSKTPKNKISHIFLIHYENFMASINSLGFFNLSHAFWCEKNHYRGRTLAKHGRFRKTLVKTLASFFSRFLT